MAGGGGGGLKTILKTAPLLFARVAGRKVSFKGLVQNRNLRELTHNQIYDAFRSTPFTLTSHAVKRLKDIRTKNLGFRTLNDIKNIFTKGVISNSRGGTIKYTYRGLEAVVNPKTGKVITIKPIH